MVADAALDDSQSAQSKDSVLVVAGSTGFVLDAELEDSQSAQSKLDEVVAGSTGLVLDEVVEDSQSAQSTLDVVADFVVLEVLAGSTVREVEELQSSQRNELVVVAVVAALTGVSLVVEVLLVVFPSTGVFEAEDVVVFQSTQVSRATFS